MSTTPDALGNLTRSDEESRRPLRIVHCLWDGEIGGAERAVYQLVREQMDHPDVDPAILFAKSGGHYWSEAKKLGCPVITPELPHGHALTHIRRAAHAMRDFDVHHFHSAEPLLMVSSIACPSATRVYTHRGGFFRYGPAARLRYEMTGLLVRRYFHAFSGNTQHATRAGARLYRLPLERFDVTYNPVATELLAPRRSADDVRAELGLAPSDFVLGTAANLKPWKRIHRLLDVVATDAPDVRLLVIGDGPERQHLEAQAERLGIASRVIFAGAQPNAFDYIQVMDTFCLPSMGLESFGNAAVEAMGMGIPTLVFSDGGGLTEHIVNGRNGFVVYDNRGVAETVNRLRFDSQLRHEIGKNASDVVRARYTPAKTAAAYYGLYEKAFVSSGRKKLDSGNR